MNSEWFEKVIKEQIKTCEDVLIGKAKEYATDDDRLHNFKNAAGMMSCDPKEALAGMMAKHTISVYDMCRSGKDYPIELWNEKITDHINYLLLLKAIVEEDYWHETLGNEGEKYCNKMLVNEGEKYCNKMLVNEGEKYCNKMLDIKKDIQEVKNIIKALKICGKSDYCDEECLECPYYIYYPRGCVEHLKEDAAEKLEFFIKLQDPMGLMNKEEHHDNT